MTTPIAGWKVIRINYFARWVRGCRSLDRETRFSLSIYVNRYRKILEYCLLGYFRMSTKKEGFWQLEDIAQCKMCSNLPRKLQS